MMHDLIVPLLLAGAEIETDDALAVEIVAGPMSAIVITGRRFDRQVYETQLLVDRHLRPDAGVARGVGRVVEPRLVSGLAALGDRVERPQTLARARVEAADVALV